MDDFLRVLRVGCISVFVIVALGVGACTTVWWVDARAKQSVRDSLRRHSFEMLGAAKSNSAVVKATDLFGDDIDGVCVVLTGPANEAEMSRLSPSKFGPVISQIAKMEDARSTFGRPWEGDAEYLFVYAVNGDQVRRKYELIFRSGLEIDLDDGTDERCYERETPVYLEYNPSYENLVISVPAKVSPKRQRR